MKNIKTKIYVYVLIFLVITLTPIIIYPLLVPAVETSHTPWFLLGYGTIYWIFQSIIFFIEKRNNRFIVIQTLTLLLFFAYLIALIPFFGILINANLNDVYGYIMTILISLVTISPFVYILKYILLSTYKNNKYEELIIRKVYFLIFKRINYEIKENYLILIKKDKKISLIYLNQEDNIEKIVFKHNVKVKEESKINDLFVEMDKLEQKNLTIIPDDKIAFQLRELQKSFFKVILTYEIEKEILIVGEKPNDIDVVSFPNLDQSITKAFKKNKNE